MAAKTIKLNNEIGEMNIEMGKLKATFFEKENELKLF